MLFREGLRLRESDPETARERIVAARKLYDQVGRTADSAYAAVAIGELLVEADPPAAKDLPTTAIGVLGDWTHREKVAEAQELLARNDDGSQPGR